MSDRLTEMQEKGAEAASDTYYTVNEYNIERYCLAAMIRDAFVAAGVPELLSEIEALRKERERAEASRDAFQEQWEAADKQISDFLDTAERAKRERDSLAERVKDLETQKAELQYYNANLHGQLSRLRALAERMSTWGCKNPPCNSDVCHAIEEYRSGAWMKGEAKTEPKEVHQPLTSCCVCGDPVCTYELDACPDKREDHKNGVELTDGRWTCSEPCWEKATEDEGKGGE